MVASVVYLPVYYTGYSKLFSVKVYVFALISCQSQKYSNHVVYCFAILSRSPDDGDLVERLPRWHHDAKTCLESSHRQSSLRRKHNLSSSRKKYWEINCENFITLVVMNGPWCMLYIFWVGRGAYRVLLLLEGRGATVATPSGLKSLNTKMAN